MLLLIIVCSHVPKTRYASLLLLESSCYFLKMNLGEVNLYVDQCV